MSSCYCLPLASRELPVLLINLCISLPMKLLDLQRLLLTCLICLLAGWLLKMLNLPAPFLLGSLFGTWFAGRVLLPYFPKLPALGIPRWFNIAVVLGLSTLIGAAFQPEMIAKLSIWSGSVVAMLLTTLLATAAGYYYLHHIRAYDRILALLCTLPGGQAEVIALSRDLVEKDYVVAFCHLVRVAFIASLIPLLLFLTEGQMGVEASYTATAQLPHLQNLSALDLLHFAAIAGGGFLFAKLIRLPIAHLLGPLIVSSVAHLFGWVEIPRVQEFIILAQVTIGGGVGSRLAQIETREIISYLGDALVNTLILVVIYCGVALLVGRYMAIEPMKMILAFIPGGIYEVTVLALIFGYELAFVAFHHTVRLLLVFLSLPVVAGWFAKDADK